MVVCIMVLCNIKSDVCSLCSGSIIINIQSALQRVPSYLIGMAFGEYCKNGCKVTFAQLSFFLFLGAIYVGFYFLCKDIFVGWLVMPIIILLLVKLLDYYPSLSHYLIPIGKISLESYLTNIYINHLLRVLIPSRFNHEIFNGRYLEYSIVVVLGLVIAFYVNRKSSKIIYYVMKA